MNDQNNLIDGLNTSQILVGLDLGTKTIGVAVSDRSKIIATPLSIIRRKGTNKDLGGTMRLGLYEAKLRHNSLIQKIYKSKSIFERHRHRYEVNSNLKEKFENKGMLFSGMSPDNKLPEIVELKNHPWFIGVQFHPEFRSRPLTPHPLFSSFIKAAKFYK